MSEELKRGTKRKPSSNQWVRRSTCFQTSEVDKEKKLHISFSKTCQKLHHMYSRQFWNVQTSHFVKVLFVISLTQSRDGVSFFLNARCFFRAFLSTCRKTTKMDWKNLEFCVDVFAKVVGTSIHRCWKSSRVVQKREPNGYLWIRGSTCFQTPEVDR